MGATFAFTDLENLAGTSIAQLGVLEEECCYFEPEIESEHQFEDIVGLPARLVQQSLFLRGSRGR